MATLVGVGHGFRPVVFLNLTAFGMLLSILLLKHGSLMVPIAFHMGVVLVLAGANVFRPFSRPYEALDFEISDFLGMGVHSLNINVFDSWINLVIQGLMILWVTWRMSRKRSKAE
jgi:hypothetical protein